MRSTGLPSLILAACILAARLLTAGLLAGCVARLEPPGPAVMAPAEADGAFVMPDGFRLPYRSWLPSGPPETVVLALHGMNDSRDAWEIPAPDFAKAGIAVFSPDQRGFGATATRGYFAGADGLVSDARVMTMLLRARYPKARLVLMGESMGAAVLIVLATSPDPPPVDGYVFVAPAVWGGPNLNILLRGILFAAARIVPGYELVNRGYVKIKASDNREAIRRLSTDPLTLLGTRVDATEGLVGLMDAAVAAIPRFQAPALFLYGGKDDLVPKNATAAAWRTLPPVAVTLAWYPDHYHMAMRDLGRADVIGDTIAWIKHPSALLPSGADKAARDWLKSRN